MSLQEKICRGLFCRSWLLEIVQDRLDTRGIACEFHGLVKLLSLARGFPIVTTASSLLVNLWIQLMRTRVASWCTMATGLVVVAGVILFPSTRGLSRASRVRHFDLFYLMMLFFGWTRCSLSVLSGYLSEIEDIIKNLVVGCLWGIHWETSATVRLVCIDCSLIWKVIAVACVVLLSMLGCIVLLHLDLVQEILSGIETSIRWSAQTST